MLLKCWVVCCVRVAKGGHAGSLRRNCAGGSPTTPEASSTTTCVTVLSREENMLPRSQERICPCHHKYWQYTRHLKACSALRGLAGSRWHCDGRAAPPGESVAQPESANASSHPRCPRPAPG